MSRTKKLDNLLGMNKPAGNRQGLGYVKHDNNAASFSKATFIPASNTSSNITNLEPESKSFLGQRTSRIHRTTTPKNQFQQSRGFEPRFIPSCHNCGVLGHMRPRCHKLVNMGRSNDIHSQVNFLSNQVSHLTEMMTKLTMITSTSRKVWVKKSDMSRFDEILNCYVAFKAQNTTMWYLDSACSRHMCGNKASFSTLDNCNGGIVTFGDGATVLILGKSTVNISGLYFTLKD